MLEQRFCYVNPFAIRDIVSGELFHEGVLVMVATGHARAAYGAELGDSRPGGCSGVTGAKFTVGRVIEMGRPRVNVTCFSLISTSDQSAA